MMSIRILLQAIAITAVCSGYQPVVRANDLPNIVILYADDMGYGDLAIQNPDSKIPTPNLDQLAREGIRFTDGHSSSGICTPSRYALLTGRYHWRKLYGIVGSFGPSVFESDRMTLPEMLKKKGYATACVGKWHLGWDWDAIRNQEVDQVPVGDGRRRMFPPEAFDWTKSIPDGPLAHGFDYYFGDDVPNFPPYTYIENDRVICVPEDRMTQNPPTVEGTWSARPGPKVSGWKLEDVVPRNTEMAVKWIEQQSDARPFFLYFPLNSPHAPIVPADQFTGSSEAGGYGDFMVETDWSCGEILEAIDANGFRENTLIVFTSDNGPERYAYPRVLDFGHRSTAGLRGLKRDIWEGGHRVPFVVRWPGVAPEGSINDSLISQIDLMATIASIVEYELPDECAEDSLDQSSLFRGEEYSVRTILVHNTRPRKWALRKDNWVLIDAKDGYETALPQEIAALEEYEDNDVDHALFDLAIDRGQRNNVAVQYPGVVKRMRKLLNEIKAEGRAAAK